MASTLTFLLHQGNVGYCPDLLKSEEFGKKDVLDKYEKKLRNCLGVSSNTRWDLAILIAKFVRSGAWSAFSKETHNLYDTWSKEHPGLKCSDNPYYPVGGNWYQDNSIYLLTFMKEKFGICRTTLYNYLEVVDVFATYITDKDKEPEYSINAEALNYQFWQLIEMTSLTYQERLKVQPNWTRAEIRAYKKSLKEKSTWSTVQPAELVEAEKKPTSEAQQRFAKYSKDDLINLVLKLEKTCEESKLTFEKLLHRPGKSKFQMPEKKELTSFIEEKLCSYNYVIHLHGRKQGIKAFAGTLANIIFAGYDSKSDTDGTSADNDLKQEQFAV